MLYKTTPRKFYITKNNNKVDSIETVNLVDFLNDFIFSKII